MATDNEKETDNRPLADKRQKGTGEMKSTNGTNKETAPEQTRTKDQDKKKVADDNSFGFSDISNGPGSGAPGDVSFLLDIPLEITVELGRTEMFVRDLLKLKQGSVISLSKIAGETLEILANQKLIARGEVVAVKDKYGIRLTEIASPTERVEKLK